MAKINKTEVYSTRVPNLNDMVVGTRVDENGKTVNFTVFDLLSLASSIQENMLIHIANIEFDDNILTVHNSISDISLWRINNLVYSDSEERFFEINPTELNHYRVDKLVVTTDEENPFVYVVGDEDESVFIEPETPFNTLAVRRIYVNNNNINIDNPEPVFYPEINNPQNGQVVQFENGVWHNAFLDLQGDRFLQIEDVEINGTTVTLPLGFMWIINGVAYSNLAPFVQNITLAETGKTRFDKFVALTNNSFLYIVGEEHETNPPIPQTLPNTLEVTTIPVFDDGVGSPTEPIIGSQYIKKTGWRFLGFGNGSAVNIPLSVLTENSRNFAITSYGGASILSGLNVSTTNDTTYVAQIVTIANFSGEDIPMFQMDENTDLPLDFGIEGEGRHIKNKEVLTFRRISKGTANDRLLLIASNKSSVSENLITPILYQDLVDLRDNDQLIAGQQYRITDFVTTTNDDNDWYISAEHQFDIIVTANSENQLNEKARAIRHQGDTYFPDYTKFEAWELKYCLDNDALRFEWADYGSGNGKGVIYYMKDENNNELPYDFKSIKFKRVLIEDVITDNPQLENLYIDTYFGLPNVFSRNSVLFSFDDNDFDYFYTFHGLVGNDLSIYSGESYGKTPILENIIKVSNWSIEADDVVYRQQHLNNIVFVDLQGHNRVNGNFFSEDCSDMTFGNSVGSNTFGNDVRYNTFGNNVYYNTFGNDVRSNTFGNDVGLNTFGNGAWSNTFGNDVGSNTFGNDVRYNTFGNNVYYNTFGNDVGSNTFGNNVRSNTFGNDVGSNTFGNNKGGIGNTFYGTYLFIKDGIKGISATNMFNVDDALEEFSSTPRQVTIEQSDTPFKYNVINIIDADNTEIVEVTVTP